MSLLNCNVNISTRYTSRQRARGRQHHAGLGFTSSSASARVVPSLCCVAATGSSGRQAVLDKPTPSDPAKVDSLPHTLPEQLISLQASFASHGNHADRTSGIMLGALCGNVLGVPAQEERWYEVIRRWPQGLTSFTRHDMHRQPMAYGTYTGDFGSMLAVAQSLAAHGRASAPDMLSALAASYAAGRSSRRYSRYDILVLESALRGTFYEAIPYLVAGDLKEQSINTRSPVLVTASDASMQQQPAKNILISGGSSDRFEAEPEGPADYNAAARAAPIGLAYRHADSSVLLQAVRQLCAFSHASAAGMEGAVMMAAATAWLSQTSADDSTPHALLQHLHSVAHSDEMRARLVLMQDKLVQAGDIASWDHHFTTRTWAQQTAVLAQITHHSFATTGHEAVSVALWALVTNWQQPQQAVVTATMCGGHSSAVGQMAGALAGALHGSRWVPADWRQALEEGEGQQGLAAVVDVAERLAQLDVTNTPAQRQ